MDDKVLASLDKMKDTSEAPDAEMRTSRGPMEKNRTR